MYVDNSGVISMVANPVDHQANKHVQISQHYTRELAAQRVTVPQRVDTSENPADAFTKPLPAASFKRFANLLMGDGVGSRRPRKETICMFKISDMYGVDTVGARFYKLNRDYESDSDETVVTA